MEENKVTQVSDWGEEVTKAAPKEVSDWGEEVVKKKEPTTQDSTTPLSPSALGLREAGSEVETSFASKGAEMQPVTPKVEGDRVRPTSQSMIEKIEGMTRKVKYPEYVGEKKQEPFDFKKASADVRLEEEKKKQQEISIRAEERRRNNTSLRIDDLKEQRKSLVASYNKDDVKKLIEINALIDNLQEQQKAQEQTYYSFGKLNKSATKGVENELLSYLAKNPKIADEVQKRDLTEKETYSLVRNAVAEKTMPLAQDMKMFMEDGTYNLANEKYKVSKTLQEKQDKLEQSGEKLKNLQSEYLNKSGYSSLNSQYDAARKKVDALKPVEANINSQYKLYSSQIADIDKAMGAYSSKIKGETFYGTQDELNQYNNLVKDRKLISDKIESLINSDDAKAYDNAIKQLNSISSQINSITSNLKSGEIGKLKMDYELQLKDYNAALEQYKKFDEPKVKERLGQYYETVDKINSYDKKLAKVKGQFASISEIEEAQKKFDGTGVGGDVLSIAGRAANSILDASKKLVSSPFRIASSLSDAYGPGGSAKYHLSEYIADLIEGTGKEEMFMTKYSKPFYDAETDEINWGVVPFFNSIADNVGILTLFALTGRYGAAPYASAMTAEGATALEGQQVLKAAQTATTIAPAFMVSYGENYKDALKKGFDNSQAVIYSSTMSLLEGLSELIMPDQEILFGKGAKDVMLSRFIKDYAKGKKYAAYKLAEQFIENGIGEANEENVILLGNTISTAIGSLFNENVQAELPTLNNVITTDATAGALGSLMSLPSGLSEQSELYKTGIYKFAQDFETGNKFLTRLKEKGVIDEKKYNRLVTDVQKYQAVMGTVPDGLSVPKKIGIIEKLIEAKTLRSQMNDEKDNPINAINKKKIKILTEEIENIIDDKEYDKKFEESVNTEAENAKQKMTTAPQVVLQKYATSTDEKYGYIDRGDGKGKVELTKEQFINEQRQYANQETKQQSGVDIQQPMGEGEGNIGTDGEISKQKQYEEEPVKEKDGEPMPGGIQGVRAEGEGGKESAELRPEEEALDTRNAKDIGDIQINDINSGNVVIGYHATPTGEIGTGKELGIHIGTEDVSNNIKKGRNADKGDVKKVAFRVNKPLILGDMPSWSSINVLNEMMRLKLLGIDKEKIREIRDSDLSEKEKQQRVIELAKEKGYDSFAYQNFDEGNGEFSYVLFDDSKLNDITPKEAQATPQTGSVVEGESAELRAEEEVAPEEWFDYNKLFDEQQNETKEQVEQKKQDAIDEERESNYQKSFFDKKWAKTYKEAKQKLIDQYNSAKATKEEWEAKKYKSAGGKTVFVGGELEGQNVRIDRINQKRKNNAIKNAQSEMDLAKKDLAALGLTDDEIEQSLQATPQAGSVVGGEDARKAMSKEIDSQVSAKENELIEKQKQDIEKAKKDLEAINSGDKSVIDEYVKKSGYKLITKEVIANNPKSELLKKSEGKYYNSTGASIQVKTAEQIAIDGASKKANSKPTGNKAGANQYVDAYNAITKFSEGKITAEEAKNIIEKSGLKIPKAVEQSLQATPQAGSVVGGESAKLSAEEEVGRAKPSEGSMVTIMPQKQGFMQRKMIYEGGEWKEKIGNETTRVGNAIQQKAQEAFDEQNKPKEEAVKAKPVEKAKPSKKEEPTGEKTAADSVADAILKGIGRKEKTGAEKAIESITNALKESGIKINVIENEEDYNKEAQKRGGGEGTEGMFVSTEGEIYLNKKALEGEFGETIVFHEGTHPVVNIIRNTNPALYNRMVKGAYELSAKNEGIASALKFANQYRMDVERDVDGNFNVIDEDGNIVATFDSEYKANKYVESRVSDEFVTEIIARIASGDIKIDDLPKTFVQSLIDLINKMLSVIGKEIKISDQSPYALKRNAEKIAEVLKEGRSISEVVGKENVGKYENKLHIEKAENSNNPEGLDVNLNIKDIRGNSGRGIQLSRKVDRLDDETIKSVKNNIVDYRSLSELEISRTLFYDNTKVGNLKIKNRNTGYTPKVVGKGGFFYSYMPESLKNKAVLAFTSINQAIQTLKRQMLYPNSVQAIAAQNFLTAHLGNKSTLKALFGEKGSKQLGIFQDAVKNNLEGETELLNAIKESTLNVANQKIQSGVNEGRPTNSAIEIKKIIDRNGGNLDNIKSLDNYRDKVLTFEGGDSFGARNILFTEIFQEKPTKITKATRNTHKIIHYKYGIPTLSEIAEGNNQKELNNAETGDVIKFVRPYSEPIVYTTDENIYKQYTESPTPEMVEYGIRIALLPKEALHESYPFILRGENVGVLDNYIAAPQLYEQHEKIGKVPKKQSFYAVGRMPSEAAAGKYPASPTAQGKIQFSKGSRGKLAYDETGFISVPTMVEIVKSNNPNYLGDVMEHIIEMGDKLKNGAVTTSDLSKAYMMAVSSIRSGDINVETFENAVGQKVDKVFLEPNNKIRTEGAMAYLLTTDRGADLIKHIESGKITKEDKEFIANSMKPFGMFGEGQSKYDSLFGEASKDQINLTNINEFKDLLKNGVKNTDELFDKIRKLKQISQGKIGFIANFLGIGTRGVIDAREIQGWLRGTTFKGERSENEAEIEKQLNKNLVNLTPLQKEILDRMKEVGRALGVPENLAAYIGHHMIWDAVADERTTHDGLYLAMKQNQQDFDSRLRELSERSKSNIQFSQGGRVDVKAKIAGTIKSLREQGISDKDIKDGIDKVKDQVGLSEADVNELMGVEVSEAATKPTPEREFARQVIKDVIDNYYQTKEGKLTSSEKQKARMKMSDMMAKNPSIKYIFDKLTNIHKQLEMMPTGEFKKTKNCP